MESETNLSMKSKKKDVIVLDASAIYNGVLTHNIPGIKYIPDCVLEEVRGMLKGEAIIEEALLYKELKVLAPDSESLTEIKQKASETGDIQELSDCDLSVLAIAKKLQKQYASVLILSDDYDIQNLANYIGLLCKGIHWKGITSLHEYLWICTGCGAKSKEKMKYCLECGTELIRKTQKKKMKRKRG